MHKNSPLPYHLKKWRIGHRHTLLKVFFHAFRAFYCVFEKKIYLHHAKCVVVGQKQHQILAIFLRTSAFYLYIDKQYSVITTPIFCNLNKAKRFFSSCMFFCFSRRYKEMRCYPCFIIYFNYNTF